MSRYLSSAEHTSITHAWVCLNINPIHPFLPSLLVLHLTSTSPTGPVAGPQPHVAEASLPRHGSGPEAALRSRRERPGLQQRPHPRPSHRLLQHGPRPVDALLLQPPHGWAYDLAMQNSYMPSHICKKKSRLAVLPYCKSQVYVNSAVLLVKSFPMLSLVTQDCTFLVVWSEAR